MLYLLNWEEWINNQEDLDPEFIKFVSDYFWELI